MVDIIGSADEKMMMEFSLSQSKNPVLRVGAPKITAHFTIWGLRKAADFTDWSVWLLFIYREIRRKSVSSSYFVLEGGGDPITEKS